MATTRRAEATWSGGLLAGSGSVSAATSGLFRDLPVSWATRTEDPGTNTSPEELIAAAHAACDSMAFSNILAKAGHAPERLDVSESEVVETTFHEIGHNWDEADENSHIDEFHAHENQTPHQIAAELQWVTRQRWVG